MNLIIVAKATDKQGRVVHARSKEIENYASRVDLFGSINMFISDLTHQTEKSAAESVKISDINDGWYVWQPNDDCAISWLDMAQVVQVIEGMVWATFIAEEVSVKKAAKVGSFVRRVNLN